MKMCLIGCGGISYGLHGASYVKYRDSHPGFITAACCDLDAEKAERYKRERGFLRAYTDLHEMLQTEKPDAVCVIVQPKHAMNVGLQVLEYGIPMLIEKPPGETSDETKRLIEAAKRKKVPTQVAFNRRFTPLACECRKWIEETEQDILYLRYDFQRINRTETSFHETAVHGIDAARYIAGMDFTKMHFTHQHLPIDGAEHVYLDAVMGEKTIAHLNFCPVSGVVMERITIHFVGQTIMLHLPSWGYDLPGSLTSVRQGEVMRSITGNDVCDSNEMYVTNGFYGENEHFFDSVRNGMPLEHSLENALQSMIIMEQYRDGIEYWSA